MKITHEGEAAKHLKKALLHLEHIGRREEVKRLEMYMRKSIPTLELMHNGRRYGHEAGRN